MCMKIGRNDPCHCGSGKKYKKCCLERDKSINRVEDIFEKAGLINPAFNHLMTYEEVNELSTEKIIQKLRELGIPFVEEEFLKDVETFYSAEDVSENWFSQYDVLATGKTEDFPWLAACVLWERLAPPENLSMEQMSDRIEKGYAALENNDPVQASDEWLQLWEDIQYRIDPQYTTLDYLDEQYMGSFFISNVVQELEMTLEHAGHEDPAYFERRIAFCQSFCDSFPGEELIYHNMRRAIAESYSKLGQYNQAEAEFEQLIADVPDNPWGYIGLADLLLENEQYSRAESLYKQALPLSEQHEYGDKSAVEERFVRLEKEREK